MIVLDSSFLVGFHNERDAHHQSASALVNVATRVGNILLEAQELEFVPCSDFFPEIFEAFQDQKSTKLSFADSAIAYLAQQRAAGLVLTFDDELSNIAGIQIPR